MQKLYPRGIMGIMVKMLCFIKRSFSDTERASPEVGVFCVRHMISVTWKTHGSGNYVGDRYSLNVLSNEERS